MPKRDELKCILIIGSGPIVIGQACEFDYAGSQSLRSLREDGIETVLINNHYDGSNYGRSCLLKTIDV
jgi:carbamoyl-phosphate synthase large subunit